MATTDIGRTGAADSAAALSNPALRRPLFPQIRWSAIFAGVAVGIAVQIVLELFGMAIGLSSLNVAEGERPSGTATLVWSGIWMLIAAFIGGYVAARMSGLKRKSDGVLHGAVTWGVTTLLFAALATSATGSLLSGMFSTVTPAVTSTMARGATGFGSAIPTLRRELGMNVDTGTLQRVVRDIRAGNRDDAVNTLTAAGVPSDKASTVVDQALIATGTPQAASPQGRAAANQVVGTAGKAAWGVFLAVALSLAVGIGGGVLGASGSRRVAWATPGVAPA